MFGILCKLYKVKKEGKRLQNGRKNNRNNRKLNRL